MEKIDFTKYSDTELRTIYLAEYIPWTKTGILQDGELRSFSNKLDENHDLFSLITTEKMFIAECALRFVNSEERKTTYSPPPKVNPHKRYPIPTQFYRDKVYEIIIDHSISYFNISTIPQGNKFSRFHPWLR